MLITCNGEQLGFKGPCDVEKLLTEHLGIKDFDGIAVAVNSKVIPQRLWKYNPIANHDTVLVLRATQGG
jgi:thiamine biosynthesis protein ThiS